MRRLGALLVGSALVVAACGSGTTTPTGTGAAASPAPSGSAVASPSVPTPVPTKPISQPRPTDLPVDGSCEDPNLGCLGLLVPGKRYATKGFEPTISFEVPSADWENRSDDNGAFELLSTSSPGDGIAFFLDPQALDPGIAMTVPALASWLAHDANLQVTPPAAVKVGGLSGVTLDLRIAPGATNQDPGCPVQVCVPIFTGQNPNPNDPSHWHWDWASAGTEAQRLYLLASSRGVVAVFVDSIDGTTFDPLTKAFDAMRPTLKIG